MKIVLDEKLELIPFRFAGEAKLKADFIDRQTDRKTDWRTKETTQSLFYVEDNLYGDIFHRNYLEYLERAYGRHYGVVLSPEILWYTLLSELTLLIAERPDYFRSLFTTKAEGKTNITVHKGASLALPIDQIAAKLRLLVPDGFADWFLPEFSTSTLRSNFATQAAFADAVSPYYSYSMKCCGLPSVTLLGSKEDWEKLLAHWMYIGEVFNCEEDYFSTVSGIIFSVIRQYDEVDKQFLQDIFYSERCGSGSDTEVHGWWTKLYRDQPDSLRKAANFSSHIAKVKYKDLDTDLNYQMINGIFSSYIVEDILVPEFSMVVYEDKGTK